MKIRIPGMLAALLSLVVGLVHSSAFAAPAQRPNVLFILCDDLRPDALGCYGSAHVKTPNIDRLAKEGVLFKNAFCTTSLCSPSRASILTGLYANKHGVRDNFTEIPTNLVHWPMRLRESGYQTAYMGKWHMGENNDAPRPGFDYFATHKGQGKYFDTEWNLNGEKREVLKGYYTTVVTDLALDWLKRDHGASRGPFAWGTRLRTVFIRRSRNMRAPLTRCGCRIRTALSAWATSRTGLRNAFTRGMGFTGRSSNGASSFRTIVPKR